ncbi:MAG: UDP-N-acetylmuramoyl-L-alanine--D-glutamate ligase [Actinobacteria bacterium]|nr:MAG: UDP-N-acetylmuramoyl-L-alanine--D-glutamate ligase [Actinomycetota bacterium]
MYQGKKVLVLGLGLSGIAAALKLKSLGAEVTAIDSNRSTALKQASKELQNQEIEVHLGGLRSQYLTNAKLIVTSPGIPFHNHFLVEAKKHRIPVISEVELAYELSNHLKVIGVTGTNGKTTTVNIIKAIFEQAGIAYELAGNIGSPYINVADQLKGKVLILEISSFQLHFIKKLKLDIAVLLGIAPDHLDWHLSLNNYLKDKAKLFLNQTPDCFALLNREDEYGLKVASNIKAQKKYFSSQGTSEYGFEDNYLSIAGHKICACEDLKIMGKHNIANALAASGAAYLAGASIESIQKALTGFNGLLHRMEYVLTMDGVDYYNDSKATNPDATVCALNSFHKPVVLLAGGRNKGSDFKELSSLIKDKVKAAVLFGEAKKQISRDIKGCTEITFCVTLEKAVLKAKEIAKRGDIVLLSPACASFDQFISYKERGEKFKETLNQIKEQITAAT